MTDKDIHSCGYYCDRPACVKAQRNELRDKFISTILTPTPLEPEPMIDGWPLYSGLPQPEPEPVAWISHNAGLYHGKPDESLNPLPLYTAPPQREWMEQERAVGYREGHQAALKQRVWQGLTDDEYEAMAEQYVTNCYFDTLEYAKAIEAKLKEKNT